MRRTSVVLATVVALFAVAAGTASGGQGTTTNSSLDPAVQVYVEQVPTAKGPANGNATEPKSVSTSSRGGSGVAIGAGAAAAVVLTGVGAVVLRRRRPAARA